MSIELYAAALRDAALLQAEYDDGTVEWLDVHRWLGGLDGADLRLLAGVTGPALDVGCGPGRLAAALSARGIDTLGVDIVPDAVEIARARGATAEMLSVFEPLPAEGSYAHVLLIDGNIGIGGDPQRLLRRVAQLLRPGAVAHIEVGATGSRHGTVRARLKADDGRIGGWFRWAHVSLGGLDALAAQAGMTVTSTWEDSGRWFADLRT